MADQTLIINSIKGGGSLDGDLALGSNLTAYVEEDLTFTEQTVLGTYVCVRSGVTDAGHHVFIDDNHTAWHFQLANVTGRYWGQQLPPLATIKTATDVEADTQDLQGRVPAALTGDGNIKADVLRINGDAAAAANAALFWLGALLDAGTAQTGGASAITLRAGASAEDDFYNKGVVVITGGTGANQNRKIDDYNGTTKVATVDAAWETNPDNTSTYIILGYIP